MIQVILATEPPIAIQDQSNMTRDGKGSDVVQQAMLRKPDKSARASDYGTGMQAVSTIAAC
jgi:hypothetical protein